jgi:mono/diheme cytochrome c family protein
MPDFRSGRLRPIAAALAIVCLAFTVRAADRTGPKLPPAAKVYDFDRDIKPILETSCVRCHGEAKQKSSFRLDTREWLLKGGEEHEQVIVPGRSDQSPLIQMVAGLIEDVPMPPTRENDALTPREIGLLRAWIDQGAKWPDGVALVSTAGETAETKQILASLPPAATHPIDFVRDVQPLFKEACYQCHGPRKQEAGLRLDHKPTALAGGESGPDIIPGRSAASPLIRLVATPGDQGMPREGARLTRAQIAILRGWIDQGAVWPDSASVVLPNRADHWSFKPPVRPPLPAVAHAGWAKNPIDAFVLARLEQEGLTPAPEADKATLLRRLSLDLTGLPPTLDELDAFLADPAPDAYAKQVERLLASPHYGERWARPWLDAARYADSDGFEKDKPRFAWAWRDWVITAINEDLPYDRFVVEQIAGDQLPDAGQDQLVATGYLRNSMINEEGGVDPEQFRMEAMFDRMDAIGKGVLGLTIQCAQCHNHKFDPITQADYYRMFAFLNNDHEASTPVYTSRDLMRLSEQRRQIEAVENGLRHTTPDWELRMARWEAAAKASEPAWTVIRPTVEDISTGGQRYLPQDDGSLLAQGYAPTKHEVKLTATVPATRITAFRLELLTDPNLPLGGPGRSFKGTGALTEFVVQAAPAAAGSAAKPARVKFAGATADFGDPPDTKLEPNFDDKSGKKRVTGPAAYAIDGKDDTAWGIDAGPGRRNVPRKAVFTLATPIVHVKGTQLVFLLKQNHGGWNSDDLMTNNLGRVRLSYTAAPNPVADPLPKAVRDILAIPRAQRTPAQTNAVFSYWRTTVTTPAFADANAKIEAIAKQHPEPATSQLVLQARGERRETHVLKRGDWLSPGKPIRPGVPAALNPLPANAPPTRLTFANWLVDRKAPTTARAFVNRVWQAYFGTGIVATSEDFGLQSEAPSHPELLDWLAVEFMDRGWKQKELHRLIVQSATYRQDSRVEPAKLEKDPYNRLLARGPRFRVDGEIVRDLALGISGLLNPAVGGRSVMPPAPDFLFKPPASYAPFPWIEETGPERYRRALYTYRRRSTPYPMLQTFDVPDGSTACVRRPRSNTPLQALTLLNETVSMEAARAFALKIVAEGGRTDAERLTYAFRRALSRPPTAQERQILVQLIEKQRARVAEGWINTHALTTGRDDLPVLPDGVTPATLAGYTVAARALLSLDETITKQ